MTTVTYPVKGMTCAACAVSVESILKDQDGVDNAQVNFATNSVNIHYDTGSTTILQLSDAVAEIGYELIIQSDPEAIKQEKEEGYRLLKRKFWLSLLFTLPVFVISMFMLPIPFSTWVQLVLTLPIIFYSGRHFYISAYKKARHATFNMDTLIAIGTGAAFLFSLFNTIAPAFLLNQGLTPHVYYESAVVIITLILLGNLLEERAKQKTSGAIEKLMGLQPNKATIMFVNKPMIVKIEDVKIGDVVLVKPGETIPVDGILVKGNTSINESMLTGEPMPVYKMLGENVAAGTVNNEDTIQIKTTKIGTQTALAKIIRYVQEAQGSKAPIQKLADKISSVFVPVVISIALLSAVVWFAVGPEPPLTNAFIALVTVLIIACPCALGLATPTAIMVGIGRSAGQGILIKNAEALEQIQHINTLFVDKTGTLTEGKPQVADLIYSESPQILDIIYSLESQSEHPLAHAITSHLTNKGAKSIEVNDFKNHPGRGVIATIAGQKCVLGKPSFVINEGTVHPFRNEQQQFIKEGKTTIILSIDNKIEAVTAITDQIKASTPNAIEQLKMKGIEVIMLTGDNTESAKRVADSCGITEFKAEVMPEDKANFIWQKQNEGHIVAMAGDGINDAPSLALADVGIAMGSGTDIAKETAAITLVSGDINKIDQAIGLSRITSKTIRQNLFWAFFYNILAIPVAAGLLYPIFGFTLSPMIAGGAMAFSSLSVVLNSLRLKKKTI